MTFESPQTPALRVSVAICTCNGEKFVAQQLQSILEQSHPVDEIVLCDDASNDATPALVKTIAEKSPIPIKLHFNPSRLGVTKNFEMAISLCTGDLIFLSDQDDLWLPTKVRRLLRCFDNPDVGLAFSNALVVREDLSPAGYRLWESIWFDPSEQHRVVAGEAFPVLLRHAIAAGSTLAFRADYLPLVLPIPDFPHSHDIWIALLIAAVARLAPIDDNLVQYRLHESNHVGLRNHGFLGQIRMARQQLETKAFRYAAELHAAARDRLVSQTRWPLKDQTKALIDEKIRHSRLRDEMPARWMPRIPLIANELRRGNYAKYSYGLKSVLQDLFLR